MSGLVFEVESYDEEAGGWVLETKRTSRKAAEEDVDDFRTVGKRARIVGDDHVSYGDLGR